MVDVTPVVSDVTGPPSMLPRHDIQELRSLKQEMDARGSLLGRTWSELSGIMDKYQARLLEKHDQVEFKAVPVDHQKYETLEKRVSDLEQKLLAKDSEIVELRTAVHQYKNEVRMKDNLIEKIQNQMAKEAMEFQTEISSLRDMLERRENGGGEANIGATAGLVKRRKIHVNKPVSQSPESSTPVSQPSPSLRLSKPVFPGPEPLFTEASPNYTNMHNQNFPNSANRQRDNSKNLTQNFENQNFEIENAEEEEGEESVAERVGVKLEEADEVPEEVYAGLEQAEDEMMLQQVLDTGQGSSGQAHMRLPLRTPSYIPNRGRPRKSPPVHIKSISLLKSMIPNSSQDSSPSQVKSVNLLKSIMPVLTNVPGLENSSFPGDSPDTTRCPHCNMGLPLGSLVSHLRSKHGLKPYGCKHCALRFGLKSECMQHARKCSKMKQS